MCRSSLRACLPLALALLGFLAPSAFGRSSAATPQAAQEREVTFRFVPPAGTDVHSASLRGSFNGWGETPMERQSDGSWTATLRLAPGEYQYKFFVNGEWPADMSAGPEGAPIDPDADGYAQDGYGGKNAVRKVGGGTAHAPNRDPAELEARMDAMRAAIDGASIEIFPVIVGNEGNVMISRLVALLLERCGLEDLRVRETPFNVSAVSDVWTNSAVFGDFVRGASLDADYALLGEFRRRPDGGLEVRCIVVDRDGQPAWVDSHIIGRTSSQMEATQVLVARLRTRLGLPGFDREDAPEGKWAEFLRKESGLPPDEEIAAMEKRAAAMRPKLAGARVLVFPILLPDGTNHEAAAALAALLERDGLCRASAADEEVSVTFEPGPSQLKRAWDMARGFQQHVREHGLDADYGLCAEYLLDSRARRVHAVNFALCDAEGAWVLVDVMNSHHDDFQSIHPEDVDDCNRLLVTRMARHAAGDETRESEDPSRR